MLLLSRYEDRNYDGNSVKKALVLFKGEQYHISDNGEEVFIFYAKPNKEGYHVAVAGRKGCSIEYVIENFKSFFEKYKFE